MVINPGTHTQLRGNSHFIVLTFLFPRPCISPALFLCLSSLGKKCCLLFLLWWTKALKFNQTPPKNPASVLVRAPWLSDAPGTRRTMGQLTLWASLWVLSLCLLRGPSMICCLHPVLPDAHCYRCSSPLCHLVLSIDESWILHKGFSDPQRLMPISSSALP